MSFVGLLGALCRWPPLYGPQIKFGATEGTEAARGLAAALGEIPAAERGYDGERGRV